MYIDATTIITFGGVIAVLAAIITYLVKFQKWLIGIRQQDTDIRHIKEEQRLLTKSVYACLQGLHKQGCNGPVSKAIKEIDEHLNRQAHN